jgi:beta-phosphoglucomutase-like phosphatase (HAD superfamily)
MTEARQEELASYFGLPSRIRACLFDLDAVLVQTAHLHAAAWAQTLDEFFKRRALHTGGELTAFDLAPDGRSRLQWLASFDGVRAFLRRRGVDLPEGDADDPVDAASVRGLANREGECFLAGVRRHGVEPYPGSIEYIRAVRAGGLATAAISIHPHTREVLEAAGMAHLFEERLDAVDIHHLQLKEKPAPDVLLAAARALWIFPAEAAVFDGTASGIRAARAGSFGYVVGVDHLSEPHVLRHNGADAVVGNLAQLLKCT